MSKTTKDFIKETRSGDYKDGILDGLKFASALLCVTSDEIRLAAGELTPQEMKLVKAVLNWRSAAILEMVEVLS